MRGHPTVCPRISNYRETQVYRTWSNREEPPEMPKPPILEQTWSSTRRLKVALAFS